MKKRPLFLLFVVSFVALLATACSDLVTSPQTDSTDLSSPTAPPSPTGHFLGASMLSSNFAVVGNAAVTCTDGSIVGDVGTFEESPIGSFTDTNCELDGEVDVGGDLAKQEYNIFIAEYAALADVVCDENLTGSTLTAVTLQPGVHCFGAAATVTDSELKGSILAGADITLTRGTLHGSAWAGATGDGDVSITGTDVLGCTTPGNGDNGSGDKGDGDKGDGDK